MNSSMPLSLIISWLLFFGFLNTHQRHAKNFQGASRGYLLALQVSIFLGSLVGLGLLVYYFIQVSWYWPLVLFVVGSLIGGFFFGFLDIKIGTLGMSFISFLGWPASAIWIFFIIRGLQP
ncbi:MAG: hypothetical protein GF353_28345 [Candidatus Lokiarchaeota archaeon]|nr:hypothetical protein [Candidatus Lokiarchaeota archaeon]